MILAASQSTAWSSFHACTAIPLFLSNLLTADLCSVTLFCSVTPRFPDVYVLTVLAWDLIHHTLSLFTMGSPLSPIVANLYMEAFESRALETAILKPKLWLRYVDDIFAVWGYGEEPLNTLHDHLNSQHPAIQFTIEQEVDGRIPFLDILVERKDTSVHTSVFRKKTHTDRYINFNSHHHPRILTGVIKCLKDRAVRICHKSKN